MRKLSVARIIENIAKEIPFEATVLDGSFSIKIKRYVPYVCTAIHNGNRLREDLLGKIALSEYERWYEEDPFTADFVSSLPIVLIGNDSRFEYDLNRNPDTAIYEEAWGKKVWKKKLTRQQKEISLEKHRNYYKVTAALIAALEDKYDGCVVYDIHSYNYKRWEREVPLFNIGTERVDPKFSRTIEHWKEELQKIELDHTENITAINDVFYGRGYNLEFITSNFKKTLVLATELKKVFCDELNGESFPTVIRSVQSQFKNAILENVNFFTRYHTNWESEKLGALLPKNLEATILKVDAEFAALVKNFELLNFVNPINVIQEKKKFFKNLCTINPEFEYRPVQIDPFQLKRQLLSLEIDKINDVSIRNMYEATVNGYIDKIDMLASLGTDDFLYNSLRYFGEPSKTDIRNAKYLLLLPNPEEELESPKNCGVEQAKSMFEKTIKRYGFDAKIGVTNQLVADIMVLNQQRKIMLRKGLKITQRDLNGLAHHEVGVHLVTTMNSNMQPIKLFNIGLPVNTCTQEGLAVLSEFVSGNITVDRLKKLAFRVIAVDAMCQGADFKSCYKLLVEDYNMDKDAAFTITTRVYRGGGFTKDYLYLKGFAEIYKFWKEDGDLTPLLIGKTSFEYYNTIVEMMERGMLVKPKYITEPFDKRFKGKINPLYSYIASGILSSSSRSLS